MSAAERPLPPSLVCFATQAREGRGSARHWPYLLLLLAVAACTPDYPMDKPGTWNLQQYGGANDANLRAMVANPRDLIAGTGESTSVGREAVPPVDRLFTGKRPPLPSLNTLDVTVLPTEVQPAEGGGNAGQ